jgi:5-methylcytosine-specific restriction enzyme B
MAKRRKEGADTVYRASGEWITRCLRQGTYLFSDEPAGWSADQFDALADLLTPDKNPAGQPFLEGLELKLRSASADVTQLAAELLYVQLLISTAITGERKREIIATVLSWTDRVCPISPVLDEAFDHGLVRPGRLFSMKRSVSFAYLVRFGQMWSSLTDVSAFEGLADPWRFKELVHGVPVGSAFAQRNLLLHLVHPDTFDAVPSDSHKGRIARRFRTAPRASEGDIDRQLIDVRRALSPADPGSIDFYSDIYTAQWASSNQ